LLALCELQEELLSFFKTIFNSFNWLFGKELILNDELMEVVSKEICANMSSMAIIDAKEGAFWPFTTTELLRLGFHNI